MPTKTKPSPTVSAPELTVDTFKYFICEHGTYRIVKTRFSLYKSIDKEGNDLITGLTEEGVHACTPLHLLAQQPDYDGKYDTVVGSAAVTPDL